MPRSLRLAVAALFALGLSARAADVVGPAGAPETPGALGAPRVEAPQLPALDIPALPQSVVPGAENLGAPAQTLPQPAAGAAASAAQAGAIVPALGVTPAPASQAPQQAVPAAPLRSSPDLGTNSAQRTVEALAQRSAAQPASDASASGSAAAFDGARSEGDASGATLRVHEHDGVPHLHSYHQDEPAPAPGADLVRRQPPVQIPDRLKPLLPSAQDPATWTGLITLHLHSVYSDGTMEPEALVQLAYDKGVRELAVSEHDTTASTLRAWKKARELGMTYHTAVEFTARGGAHIGGVDIDIADPKVKDLLARVHDARYLRAKDVVEYLNGPKVVEDLEKQSQQPEERWENDADGKSSKVVLPAGRNSASEALRRLKDFRARGGVIKLEDVVAQSRHNEGGTIEFPHIARVLLANGLIDSVDQAFDAFLKGAVGNRSAAPPDPTPEEVIDVIHSAGGKAILNHPYTVHGRDPAEQQRNIDQILDAGIDGIEVYRPSHATSANGKRKADERAAGYLLEAEKRDLFAAPGADFHGTDTHLDTLVVWMPKVLAAQLQQRLGASNAAAIARLEQLERAGSQPPTPTGAAALLAAPLLSSSLTLNDIPWIAFVPAGLLGALFALGMSDWFKRFELKHKLLSDMMLLALAVGFAGSLFGIMWTRLGL